MIVVVAVTKIKTSKVMFLVFCSDCNNGNGKVNERRTIYGKLVGNESVIENYAICGSSCNSHNLG